MGKKLATYHTKDNWGYCEVHFDYKEEYGYIKYFDDTGKMFFLEEFPNHSIDYIHEAAENWALGIKQLGEVG